MTITKCKHCPMYNPEAFTTCPFHDMGVDGEQTACADMYEED